MAKHGFGRTWWGKAWVDALEASATGDASRLGRGRTVVRNGAVTDLQIDTGLVTATVPGQDGEIYKPDLAIKPLASSEWDQLIEAIGNRASHAAALLDRELDPEILQDAEAVDIHLIPRPSDIRPGCNCSDWATPCKHAAAVGYTLADALDDDPFTLFQLRGMASEELLSRVRQFRAGSSGNASPVEVSDDTLPGTDAQAAWSARPLGTPLGELDEIASHGATAPPREPGHRSEWDVELPADQHIDGGAIDALADDTVLRAWAMLRSGAPSGLNIASRADLARRTTNLEGRAVDRLADRAALPADQLRSYAKAWPLGGALGVEMIVDKKLWVKDQERLANGREELMTLGYAKSAIALSYNSLGIEGNVFLVLGPDERWYRIAASGRRDQHELEAPPADTITELVEPIA